MKSSIPIRTRDGAKSRCDIVCEDPRFRIPSWVVDLESFSRWADTKDCPEEGRICYIQGEIWLDMPWQEVFSHVALKTAVNSELYVLVRRKDLGNYWGDGLRIRNVEANLSFLPNGSFVATESLRSGRVRLIQGAKEGFVELEGAPDMVLEFVSNSTVRKNTIRLGDLYWKAGIQEYWLVDARKTPLKFDIFRHTAKGYVATRKQSGWVKSAVFGKAFRLTQQTDELGHPRYALEMR